MMVSSWEIKPQHLCGDHANVTLQEGQLKQGGGCYWTLLSVGAYCPIWHKGSTVSTFIYLKLYIRLLPDEGDLWNQKTAAVSLEKQQQNACIQKIPVPVNHRPGTVLASEDTKMTETKSQQ